MTSKPFGVNVTILPMLGKVCVQFTVTYMWDTYFGTCVGHILQERYIPLASRAQVDMDGIVQAIIDEGVKVHF